MRIVLTLLAFTISHTAFAQPAEPAIREVIANWYAELAKKNEARISGLTTPHFIEATPHYRYIDTGSAALGPRVSTSLAATALEFRYEIEAMRADASFARVMVWERGYFYAAAAQKTYERAMSTTFILERGEVDGRWRILAHESGSYGIPPNKITNPMPDLRALYYATEGKDRNPEEDAAKAGNF